MDDVILTRDIFDRLRQATAASPEVLGELCRDYVAEARNTIGQLRGALDVQDAVAVRDRAHYLKGSSMMIGAATLSRCCETLEQMGRNSQLSTAQPALQQVEAALGEVEAELAKELGPWCSRPEDNLLG